MTNQSEPLDTPSRARSRKKRKKTAWIYALLGVLLVIAVIAIYYIYSILSFAGHIQKTPDESRIGTDDPDGGEQADPIPRWEGRERVNILLLGGDSRGLGKNEKPRSDTMIIVSIDPVTKKAHLLSVLRDTYGEIPGHGRDRINAAITYGGPELAMRTISNLTGLDIQYYVYTDFQGFIALIDELGGIEFEVEKRMYYKDTNDDPMYHIDLKPGLQKMDGKTALAYVRFRHDALSDYTRTERQRKFLTALAEKLKSTWSLIRLPALLDSIKPYVETNLKLDDMLKLAALGLEVDTSDITSAQLPPMELLREETIRGMSVITVRDEQKLKAYVQELMAPEEPAAGEAGAEAAGAAGAAGADGTSGGGAGLDGARQDGAGGTGRAGKAGTGGTR